MTVTLANTMARGIASGAVLMLAGCGLPLHETVQPEASLTVRSETGTPIQGAQVRLNMRAIPSTKHAIAVVLTDTDGRASFPEVKEWHTRYPLMMHGTVEYRWAWCVSKAGYQDHDERWSAEFKPYAVVTMKEGNSRGCPVGT